MSILLEHSSETDEYALPSEYVKKESKIQELARSCRIEDDGDLVLIADTLNENHLNRKGKEWVSLDKLADINIRSNESLRISHRILRYFLPLCPREGESGVIRKVSQMLDSVKIDIAKKEYVDMIRRALDGDLPDFFGASISLPDTTKVKRELETLEHFRLVKPNRVPMNRRDGYLLDNGLYTYTVDWETLGFVITPLPPSIDPSLDFSEKLGVSKTLVTAASSQIHCPPKEMRGKVLNEYIGEDEVARFNRERIVNL